MRILRPSRPTVRVVYHYGGRQFDTGSPRALVGLIDGLERSSFEPWYWGESGPLVDALAARGVRIVNADAKPVDRRHPLRSIHQIRRVIGRLREIRPSILHVMSFGWNLDLVLGCWLLRIPIILHVHNPEAAGFTNLHRLAASTVLFCSEAERRNFGHIVRIAHKTEVLCNPVDVAAFTRAKPARERFGLRDGQIAVVTVAQISRRKGIDIVLEVAELLLASRPDLVFLIAGPDGTGEADFAAEMRERASQAGFCGRVRLLGSRQDIPELLASADLFLLPTRAEPFGIVNIEAMAAGLPVIASDVGGIPEIINRPDIGRLVSPITPSAFAEAVREVLAQPDHGRTMGDRARQSVGSRFDTKIIGEQLAALYQGLIST